MTEANGTIWAAQAHITWRGWYPAFFLLRLEFLEYVA